MSYKALDQFPLSTTDIKRGHFYDTGQPCARCHKPGLTSSRHRWYVNRRICRDCWIEMAVIDPDEPECHASGIHL